MPRKGGVMQEIQWECCPIPDGKRHTVFQGWHVHDWGHMICFYPAEGDATRQEIEDLLARIPEQYKIGPPDPRPFILRNVYGHRYSSPEREACSLKERHDGSEFNHCLEIHAPLDECFDLLGQLTDELFEQAGLGKAEMPVKEGRIF